MNSEELYIMADEKENAEEFEEAFQILMKGAKAGHAGCQGKLGYYYDNGYGTRKNIKKAIEWYTQAIKTDPHSGDAMLAIHNIGTVRRRQRRYKETEKCFLKAIKKGLVEDHLDLALLLMDSNIEKAITHLRIMSAVQPDPRDGITIYYKGIARYLLYLIEKSRREQRKMLLSGQRHTHLFSRKGMTELDIALTLLVHGKLKKAKQYLRRILENPKTPPRCWDIALTVLVAVK